MVCQVYGWWRFSIELVGRPYNKKQNKDKIGALTAGPPDTDRLVRHSSSFTMTRPEPWQLTRQTQTDWSDIALVPYKDRIGAMAAGPPDTDKLVRHRSSPLHKQGWSLGSWPTRHRQTGQT